MSLKIINLTKRFGKETIIDNFSYEFSDSGIYCIIGESGAGKTTLLRMIAGLDITYKGEICGVGTISFAFQEHRLFPQLSALDNLIYSNYDSKSEAVIKECKNILFDLGLCKEDLSKTPDKLSGGMKQRVSLARAFMKKCDVLLLDEPTKELDEDNSKIVKSFIERLSKDRTVIMVSHNQNDWHELNAETISL